MKPFNWPSLVVGAEAVLMIPVPLIYRIRSW
jgi:hypothetical protein